MKALINKAFSVYLPFLKLYMTTTVVNEKLGHPVTPHLMQ
jgi:hypothetical protein